MGAVTSNTTRMVFSVAAIYNTLAQRLRSCLCSASAATANAAIYLGDAASTPADAAASIFLIQRLYNRRQDCWPFSNVLCDMYDAERYLV